MESGVGEVIEKVIRDHFTRYPNMQIQDLYKLLHQAALGSEHAVSDRGAVERWMTRELAEMGEGNTEPMVDPISPDGDIARVHLRPYVSAGHDPQLLLDAFIHTADDYHGETQFLENYWQDAIKLGAFSVEEMNGFFQDVKAKNFPAVHHSAEYERRYRPAYRVISRVLCPGLGL